MTIIEELLAEIKSVSKTFSHPEVDGISISINYYTPPQVHLSEKIFRHHFSEYKVYNWEGDYATYKLSLIVDGIEFFTLADKV